MAYLRSIVLFAIVAALAGCDLLTAGQDDEDRTLYPLHNAIEATLGVAPELPDTGDAPGDSEPGDDSATTDTGASEHAAAANEEIAGEDGESEAAPVAVVAVVDGYFLLEPGEDEENTTALENARRRERVTRQEIQDSLVKNKLIDALPRDAATEKQARDEIIAHNSAELSTELAAGIGTALDAAIIICALIDRDGAEVNIVAQLTSDGKLIYQETIKDWEPLVTAVDAPEVE